MNSKEKMHSKALVKSSWVRWPLLMVVGLTLIACGKEPSEPKLLAHTANEVIVPLYAELDAEALKQIEQSQAFCQAEASAQQGLQKSLQNQWRATMTAWARAQPIGFGHIEDGNLRWKLQFWPDRKDITRKKVEALIASDDDLNAERVASASVSVQGLVALEYLLFDERASDLVLYQQNARRCQLLMAITERVQLVTFQLLNDWYGDTATPGYADKFSSPGKGNKLYPDNNAALADLLDTLVVGAEVVKRNKLGLPIANGKGASHAKPYRLEAWRSQYSLELMRASTVTLEQLYRGNGGFGLVSYLAEHKEVDSSLLLAIDDAFKAVNDQFLLLEGPLFTQIKQPEYYAQLIELHKRLSVLQGNLSKLPRSLGISLGFNSNDGD